MFEIWVYATREAWMIEASVNTDAHVEAAAGKKFSNNLLNICGLITVIISNN